MIMRISAHWQKRWAAPRPAHIGILFALFGAMGFIGNVIRDAYRRAAFGAFATSVCFLSSLVIGLTTFLYSAQVHSCRGDRIFPDGLWLCGAQFHAAGQAGGRRTASRQRDRRAQYIASLCGQAIGSGIGGVMISHDLHARMGFVGIGFLPLAMDCC